MHTMCDKQLAILEVIRNLDFEVKLLTQTVVVVSHEVQIAMRKTLCESFINNDKLAEDIGLCLKIKKQFINFFHKLPEQ